MERGLVQRPILLSIETIFVVDRTDRDQTAIHHCAGILFEKRNRFSIFLIPEISELEADVLFPPTGASSSSASVRCFQELVCVKKLQRRPQLIQRSLNSPLLILTKIWVLTFDICQNNRRLSSIYISFGGKHTSDIGMLSSKTGMSPLCAIMRHYAPNCTSGQTIVGKYVHLSKQLVYTILQFKCRHRRALLAAYMVDFAYRPDIG